MFHKLRFHFIRTIPSSKATSISLPFLEHLLPRFKLHVDLRLSWIVHVGEHFEHDVKHYSHYGNKQHEYPAHRPRAEDVVRHHRKIGELAGTPAAHELVGRKRKQIKEDRDERDSDPGIRQSIHKAFTITLSARAKRPLAVDERPCFIQNLQCRKGKC